MIDLHAGDMVLKALLDALATAYAAPMKRTEGKIRAFLKPLLDALQPRKSESKTAYKRRLMIAFSGAKWSKVRDEIAADFAEAGADFTERVNDALEQAFADGLNDQAYSLHKDGAETWPITAGIVTALVNAGVIVLNRRRVKKRESQRYNRQRTQSAVMGVIARNVKVEDMPKEVSRHIANARQNEMSVYMRIAIYGASDYGAYMAGIEAEELGIDTEKSWLSIMDLRVRLSHSWLHGTTIQIHEKFHGLHGDLMYPHDPNAPLQEICNWRCRMVVHLAGKAPKTSRRLILPFEMLDYLKWRQEQIRKAGGELELEKLHKRLMR